MSNHSLVRQLLEFLFNFKMFQGILVSPCIIQCRMEEFLSFLKSVKYLPLLEILRTGDSYSQKEKMKQGQVNIYRHNKKNWNCQLVEDDVRFPSIKIDM